MAKMVARCRVTIDVPFEFNIPEAQFQPVQRPVGTGRTPGEEMANENQRTTARINAAKFVETHLIDRIKDVLDSHGEIVDELVEEVRDAE